MVLFGCKNLPEQLEERHHTGESWYCGPSGVGVCGDSKNSNSKLSETVIYAWALDAGPLKLPPSKMHKQILFILIFSRKHLIFFVSKLYPHLESGYRIGANSDIEYLVLQMHYKNEFEPGLTDNSGLTLEITREE